MATTDKPRFVIIYRDYMTGDTTQVGGPYMSRDRARSRARRLDMAHGANRHTVQVGA